MVTCPNCQEENPAKFRLCGFCGTPLVAPAPAQEERKVVTVFFSDLKGSTNLGEKLDPESLREVMTRYFDSMTEVLIRHGATIEKFIGDAIMAVFGLPKLHEDDALRAVRAANETRAALAALNENLQRTFGVELTNRTGVNTGEVVAGDPTGGQRLVTGDVVNVAARLEQAAPENEVLIGDLTYRLVRDAVTVEAVEPLELKGKAERVPAFRLLDVSDAVAGYQRRQDAPLVGRELELTQLHDIYRSAIAEGGCRMATVIADAGVGKSRLIQEFTAPMQEGATVLHGRCLPYGQGITFWPLVEAAREAGAIEPDDSPSDAIAKLGAVTGDPEITARLAAAIGLSSDSFPVEEIFWAARRFLEVMGQDRPVVVVIDDIHWAEATFLELILNLLETVEGASVLLLCTSRHDILETHPDWATDARSERIILQPLTDADAGRVVQGLLGDAGIAGAAQERIVQASEGNPLFVEQMLSMLIDNGVIHLADGRWEAASDLAELQVPPTIQALLSARLDLLGRDERAVIEPASVIGVSFAQAAVTELAPEPIRPAVLAHLESMTRKQLIRPGPATTPEDVGYRFGHILIRDAAYGGLLKRARATFHERFVDWADEVNRRQGREQEYEEILGYHLEQAYRYLAELGTVDDHARTIGERASAKLAAAGRRAFARGDIHAAVNLLRRAAGTLPTDQLPHLRLLPDLGEALMETGEFDEAELVLSKAMAGAEAIGDESLAAEAQLLRLLVEQYNFEGEDWSGRVTAAVETATPIFERDGYHPGLALAARLQVGLHGTANRYGKAAAASEQVIHHARKAGDARLERRGAAAYAISALYGPTPIGEAIERSEQLVSEVTGDRRTEGQLCRTLAVLYAMRGDFDKARATYAHAEALLRELGGFVAASGSLESAQIEILAGDLEAAEAALRHDYEALETMGERYLLSSVAGLLGRVLYEQGRFDEAHELSRTVENLSSAEDIDAQALWRGVRGKVLAQRGESEQATQLIEEMLALRRQAESPDLEAEALADLAEVQRLSGDAGWQATLAAAVAGYERKGDEASIRRITEHEDAGA
ncbi:MAG TPA: adenylate/guanylate cyclase domain-containing protein [Candidatus Limnocylindria bacterium]|nr:adenylate/guanylate cyclase domain-containing protein [Candidatus Limnocylindria bacterium]